MINTFVYTRTVIDVDKLLLNTGNCFEFVAQRPYVDKKGKLPNGVVVTLHILQDTGDYGIDKTTGRPRQNNKGQNFDVTVLNGTTSVDIQQGDRVCLEAFDPDNSYVINYELLLRFGNIKKVTAPMTSNTAVRR